MLSCDPWYAAFVVQSCRLGQECMELTYHIYPATFTESEVDAFVLMQRQRNKGFHSSSSSSSRSKSTMAPPPSKLMMKEMAALAAAVPGGGGGGQMMMMASAGAPCLLPPQMMMPAPQRCR